MKNQIVTHINQGQSYRVQIERAASTKGIDGFKVEANGDNANLVLADAQFLYAQANVLTKSVITATNTP